MIFTPLTITTSKSTLMHASLAHLSHELQTLDNIIHDAPTVSTPRRVTLPTEILLLVRESLFPMITTQLVQESTAALEAYERSLRDLLCPDCTTYNLDIYGPDIWQWEQFTGACACTDIERPAGHRHSQGHRNNRIALVTGAPDPKQFVDAQHWLESHLSRKAALRVKPRGHHQSAASATRSTPSVDIWDAVTLALRDFDCEAIREPEDRTRTSNRIGRGQFYLKCDFVQVVPLEPERALDSAGARWRAEIILHRATRDLGLEYTEPFGEHKREVFSLARRLRWSGVSRSRYRHQILFEFGQTLFSILGSLLAACLSLPITITTVALTILCFYSRPRSLRII